MFANALLAATAIFLALMFLVMGQLRFLTPWRDTILHSYWQGIAAYAVLLFVNVTGAVIFLQRKFFLKDAGQKLVHIDKQIRSGQHDLSREFADLNKEEE